MVGWRHTGRADDDVVIAGYETTWSQRLVDQFRLAQVIQVERIRSAPIPIAARGHSARIEHVGIDIIGRSADHIADKYRDQEPVARVEGDRGSKGNGLEGNTGA